MNTSGTIVLFGDFGYFDYGGPARSRDARSGAAALTDGDFGEQR
jgi:hypothetical protein